MRALAGEKGGALHWNQSLETLVSYKKVINLMPRVKTVLGSTDSLPSG